MTGAATHFEYRQAFGNRKAHIGCVGLVKIGVLPDPVLAFRRDTVKELSDFRVPELTVAVHRNPIIAGRTS